MNNELYHSSVIVNTNQNDELYHYGVPGMKWGHKKAVAPNPRAERRALKKQMKQELKQERKEMKQVMKYGKKMAKTGRPGSEMDAYDGKGSALYNKISKKKGKAFADKVLQNATKRIEAEERFEREERRAAMVDEGVSIINSFIDRFRGN